MYCSMLGSHYIDMILKSLYLQSIKHVMKLYYTRVCVCVQSIYLYVHTDRIRQAILPSKKSKDYTAVHGRSGNVSHACKCFPAGYELPEIVCVCMETCLYSYVYL